MPSVCVPSIFGVSTTSMPPLSWGPVKATLLQSRPGSTNGNAWEVSTAMTTKRLPLPSADTAAILPSKPGGMSGPNATFAQFAGSNCRPSGSFREAKNAGSMARGLMSVTVNSGPKVGFTSATLPMSAVGAGAVLAPAAQPTSQHTDVSARATLNTVANLPNRDAQLRNVDTVLTNRSAANCGVSAGSTEPGSVVNVVNA